MKLEHLEVSSPSANILQVTLNRPRQFNALAGRTFEELAAVLQEFEASADRVLLLTGAGRAFCFGADFLEFQDRSRLPELLEKFQSVIRSLYHCSRVTIAALNGFATGAGMDLALACDLRIASERAKLGEAYISMGLVPDGGGSFFLPRMIGASRALKMLMTGESLDAVEANRLGLIDELCPADQLAAKSLELAQSMAARPETALRLIKKLVRTNSQVDLESALQNERQAQLACFEDPAHLELVREFLAKRLK